MRDKERIDPDDRQTSERLERERRESEVYPESESGQHREQRFDDVSDDYRMRDRGTDVPVADRDQSPAPLLAREGTDRLRSRWAEIQTAFVDNPQVAVREADSLVDDTISRLSDLFRKERTKLEEQWSRGEDVSTEDLRVALQRYRSFFDRLLKL